MGVEPDKLVFLDHLQKLGGNALRQHYRGTSADSDDIDVIYLCKLAEDLIEACIAQCKGITTGEYNIADFLVLADVFNSSIDVILRHRGIVLTCFATTCAMTAIHRALIRKQQQYAIRISMRHPRNRCICILVKRICHIAGIDK
jgi:hypothetical protein